MKTSPHSRSLLITLLGFAVGAFSIHQVDAQSYHARVSKHLARNTEAQTSPSFGNAVAANERWIVVGEPRNDDLGADAGAVHVFDAVTGRLRHKFTAPDGEAADNFGNNVALHGSWLAVGAENDDEASGNSGAVYLYDLVQGTLIRKLIPTGADLGNARMGSSVAMSDRYVVAGAAGRKFGRGAVYVFDRLTGDQLHVLEAADGTNQDVLGDAVALSGNLLLAGAPNDDGSSGSVYLFDVLQGLELRKLANPGGGGFDFFGTSVDFDGERAVIGAENGGATDDGRVYVIDLITGGVVLTIEAPEATGNMNFGKCLSVEGSLALIGSESALNANYTLTGAVFVYDVARGRLLSKLLAPDGTLFANFGGTTANPDPGSSVALCGNRAVIGAPGQLVNGQSTGAVYQFDLVAGPLPFDSVAAVRDFAPGVLDAVYANLGEAFINPQDDVFFPATIRGAGAGGGRQFGLFSDNFSRGYSLVAQSGVDPGSGLVPVRFGQVTNNQQDLGLYTVIVRGTGVNPTNNQILFGYDGNSDPFPMLRTGDLVPALGGVLSRIGEVAQSRQEFRGQVAAVSLRPGINGVTPNDDSALLFFDENGSPTEVIREGAPSPLLAAEPYGQLDRVALPEGQAVFRAPLQADPLVNQAVFRHALGGATSRVAQKGDAAPGVAGGVFSTFLGETCSVVSDVVFRATIRGTGITAANNEGIWSDRLGPLELVARKGDQVPGLGAGVVYARFLQYTVGFSDVFFVAKLRGPGVTPANDCALFLAQDDGSLLVLLREGEAAPGCETVRVGAIQRLAMGDFGSYAVLTSLAGSPAARNQALFSGDILDPSLVLEELRRPFLQVRKGMLHSNLVSNIVRTRSLVLPRSGTFDRTGAGLKGLGSGINLSGQLAICVQFDNGAKELMKGRP